MAGGELSLDGAAPGLADSGLPGLPLPGDDDEGSDEDDDASDDEDSDSLTEDGPSPDDGPDEPQLDAAAPGPDDDQAADGAGSDAGMMPPPPEQDSGPPPAVIGTCASPHVLNVPAEGGIMSVDADTSGAANVLALPCGTLLTVDGPEHVYTLEMPFAGELEIIASGGLFSQYRPAVYVLDACGNGDALVGCDGSGQLTFGASRKVLQGERLYIYVDSGADPLLFTAPQGAYSLQVTVRKRVGLGQACGSERTQPHCDDGLACSADLCVVPVCGNGAKEGAEECDDGATAAGDGCSADCKNESES